MWFLSWYSINNNKTIFYYHSSRDDMALYFHPDPSCILWDISLIYSRSKSESITMASHWYCPSRIPVWLWTQLCCLAVCRDVPCLVPPWSLAGGQQPSQRIAAYLFQCSSASSYIRSWAGSSVPTRSNWDVCWWPVASNTKYWFGVWGCAIRPGQTEELGKEEPVDLIRFNESECRVLHKGRNNISTG